MPFGVAIGVSIGLLGGGGAVLAVPVLVYVLGEDPHVATTASLVVVLAGAACGALAQAGSGRVCWRHALGLVPAAAVGVGLGTVANRAVPGELLLAGLVPVLLAAAAATWRRARRPEAVDAATRCPSLRPLPVCACGLAVGVLTGFLGVGGGFLTVPVLTVALGFPLRSAMGTSVVAIAALALLGLVAHLGAGGGLGGAPTAVLAAGCVAGAVAGARQAPRVPQRVLAGGFAALVTGVAVAIAAAAVA